MELELNGRKIQLEEPVTVTQLAGRYFPDADVRIVNGFQTEEDLPLKAGDSVHLIQKGRMPSRCQLESMLAARHTPKVHNAVKNARVAIAGLGGLGSNIALMLARTGVGQLLLIDFDVVEPSNLNRQAYSVAHLGMLKTDAMKQQIEQVNPFVKVETAALRVTGETIQQLFQGYEIVCEAFDRPDAKAMLVSGILELLPGCKVVAASGMAGYYTANTITTCRVMKNLYLCGDSEHEARPGSGLMAPRVAVCAGHQANMVLRLITGEMEP